MQTRLLLSSFCLALSLRAQVAPPVAMASAPTPTPASTAASAAAAPSATQIPMPQVQRPASAEYNPPHLVGFPRPDYFRRVFGSMDTTVRLQAPTRLEEFVQDGKVELTLRNYLDLVLANNTQIQIQRLAVEFPRNNILGAYSIFDPILNGRFTSTRTSAPATDQLAGANILTSLNQPLNVQFTQLAPTGTQYNIGYSANKFSTNSAFANFNPAITSGFNVNFAQPLLRNRGGLITRLPITIARGRLRATEYQVQDQVIQLVAAAELAYWDVIQARENLRVQEQALALSAESLKRTRRELELGAISALDLFQPEQQYANFEIQVTQARFRLQQTEDILRRQAGLDLDVDKRTLPIVLTEPVAPPSDEISLDREGTVERAIRLRPDLKNAVQNVDIDDLSIRLARNNLLPNLSITGQYGTSGRGGTEYLYATNEVPNLTGTGVSRVRQLVGTNNLGYLGSLEQLFGFNYPVYGFGLALQLPIRDRQAQAQLANAVVSKRQNALRIRNTEQQIRQEVLNAITQLEQSRAGVRLAQVALDFARKRVDAEQKKYDLGTSVLFFLLSAQTDLTLAESQLVNQTVQFRRNQLNLLQRTGELLEARGVAVQ